MKSIFRVLACGLCVVAPALLSASDAPVMPEDVFPQLKQILADVATQSPRMVAQNLNLLVADGNLTQAKSGLYPSIGGYYTASNASDKREDLPGQTLKTDKIYYSFTINQPLFHWGERRNNAKIGEINRLIAAENYNEAYRLLVQEVRSAYLTMVGRKVLLANTAYHKKLAEEELALAESRLAKKEISEGAIFQTRINADQARLGLETAEWEYSSAIRNFATLTGQPPLNDAAVPDSIPGLAGSKAAVDKLLARFLAQGEPPTATGRILQKQIAVDDLTYKNQKTRLKPKVSLVAGISQDEQSYNMNIAQKYGLQSQYAGLTVSWSIFDGFATRGAIGSALARKRLSEHSLKEYSTRVAADAQQAARMVDLAEKQLAISERLLNNAGNFLEYTKTDFTRGQASETEVARAQAGYYNMLASTTGQRSTYLHRVSEFVSLIGADETLPAVASR
jgi:outer membrane protein TolC